MRRGGKTLQSSTRRIIAEEETWEELRTYAKVFAAEADLRAVEDNFRMQKSAQMDAFIYVWKRRRASRKVYLDLYAHEEKQMS